MIGAEESLPLLKEDEKILILKRKGFRFSYSGGQVLELKRKGFRFSYAVGKFLS